MIDESKTRTGETYRFSHTLEAGATTSRTPTRAFGRCHGGGIQSVAAATEWVC